MRNLRIAALALLAALWGCQAWAQITPEAQLLMDNHRCADGSSLSQVFKAAEAVGMKLRSAQIVSLDQGQKALQVEYGLLPADGDDVYKLFWSLDSQGHQLQAPLSSNDSDTPMPGRLTAAIVELGKACWLNNIKVCYEWWNDWLRPGVDTYRNERGKSVPIPVIDYHSGFDPSTLAAVSALGFANGLAGLVRQASLRVQRFRAFAVPPGEIRHSEPGKDWFSIDEPGVYIEARLERKAPATAKPTQGTPRQLNPLAMWRRAPGSQTFEPMDDIARQLSAGIVPPEIK